MSQPDVTGRVEQAVQLLVSTIEDCPAPARAKFARTLCTLLTRHLIRYANHL